jgi:hypothetical protein
MIASCERAGIAIRTQNSRGNIHAILLHNEPPGFLAVGTLIRDDPVAGIDGTLAATTAGRT